MLQVRLLGEIAIIRDNDPLTLPRSRKTLALLAYLIMTGRSHSRTKLCSLLWELPDDPRGALRWSLSKLRALVDEAESKRIIANRNNVSFDLTHTDVDAQELRQSFEEGFDDVPLEQLQLLAEGHEGAFLENLELPECHDFQAWRTAEQSELAQIQANLLASIIRRTENDERTHNRYNRKLEDLKRSFPELLAVTKPPGVDPLVELEIRDADGVIPLPDKPSIAVLPFTNLSDQPDQENFVDSITEDLITALAKSNLFFVIARNSSFSYKGLSVDVKKIAQELGVQYILEGSVRTVSNQVRITAQFVEATTRRHIWAERYDREIDDIFDVQDEITKKIATVAGKEFLAAEMTRAHRSHSRNPNAREYFLRGIWHYAQLKADENHTALKIAKDGLKEHPNDAELHALTSYIGMIDCLYGWNRSRTKSRHDMMSGALRAVELDKGHPFCYRSLGDALLYTKQHDVAIRTLERGVALNPNDSDSIMLLGGALGFAGEFDEAVKNFRLAVRLSPHDPFTAFFFNYMAHAAMIGGRDDAALEWSLNVKEEKPTFPGGYRIGAVMLALTGRIEEARSDLQTYLELAPNTTIGDMREVLPIKHEAAMERYLGALKMAGMPD